jgi:hypothetical protein
MPKKKVIPKEPPDKLGVDFNKIKSPYRTIKTSLKSIIKDNEIHQKINELVIRCNDIVIDTYMFIRLYALNLYHKKEVIPDLDSDFISYVFMTLGTRDNRGKKSGNDELIKKLEDFYKLEYQPIFNHTKFDLKGLSFTLPYIAISIETMLSTNLKEHFIKRLYRFINIFSNKYYDEKYMNNNKDYETEKKKEIFKLKKAIYENKFEDIPEKLKEWFNQHKNNILPTDFNKSIAYDCKSNPFKYLKYSFYMNKMYELFNDNIRQQMINNTEENNKKLNSMIIKLFQPLSLRKSCIPKYITIDTATIINMFSEKGQKGKLLQSLKENQELVWNKFFRMNTIIFRQSKDYLFNYTIQTDGIGTSLLFKHISIKDKKYGGKVKSVDNSIHYIDELSNNQLDILKTKKIVSGDPGKKFLLYMMDDEGNELKYTCMQRDTESLAKRNRRIKMTNKKQNKEIIDFETELSKYLSTTINYTKFKEFIKMKHNTNEKTKVFYQNELYRKLVWRTKTYRQKSEDKFLNNIENKFGEKNDIIICIGDWSNKQGSCIKGASTMGIGLKRLVAKKYTTLLIDEYNTSKKCCNCWQDVENVKINGNSKFRLLGCKNCKVNNIGSPEDEHKSMFQSYSFLTRDKNSCINMLSIAKHIIYNKGTRPKEFMP